MRYILNALCVFAGAFLVLPLGAAASPILQTAVDNPEAEPPVTMADLKIIQRARQLLNSPAVWNRADTRECPPAETSYSLYCAIEKATVEISESFEHRGAAMQQARFVVDELSKGRNYEHRLKDYNNDPKTSFGDIQHVFALIERRIRNKIKR